MTTLTLDEGVTPDGVGTKVHFTDDTIVVQRSFDPKPHLAHAKHARESTEGKRWGEGKMIGHIPPVFYAEILKIRDRDERDQAVTKFFRENPAFVMFDKFKA
jgi:hypothetical protein